MLNKNNKSQVTIFIVIGVILVIVAAFLLVNNKDLLLPRDTKLKNQMSDIVKLCIEDSGKRGVFLLGFQGGRINIPPEIENNPFRYVDFGYKIPNWDSERGEIPTINSMTNELHDFVIEDALSCVKTGLETMKTHFDIEIDDELNLEVEINEQNVIFTANLPIKFNEINSEELLSVSDYYVKLDSVRLKDIYELAIEIYNTEASTHFYEDLVLDQIYSASDYSDRIHSMPSEGMEISCVPQVWTKHQLMKTLANLNNHNFRYLYFDGTSSIEDKVSDLGETNRQYYDSHYVIELDNIKSSFKNYRVDTIMPTTEVTGNSGYLQRYPYREFDVTPSSGEMVRPTTMKVDMSGGKMPIPCIQVYHHLYTLDYDLIIKITDENEDGSNFFFQFPLRINIENNNPKVLAPTSVIPQVTTATNENYCKDEMLQYPLTVYVKDTKSDEYLSDVNISYECVNLACDSIGVTNRPDYRGVERVYAQPYLKTEFPFCIGGSIVANKEGYHTGELRVDTTSETTENTKGSYDVELTPILEYPIDKSTFLMVNMENMKGTRVYDDSDGYVFVSIENKDEKFSSFSMFPNEGFLNKIELLDDPSISYTVSAMYVDADQNLKGMLELEDWKPDLTAGNQISITIPSSINSIEDNYMEFYEYMNEVKNFDPYGLKLN